MFRPAALTVLSIICLSSFLPAPSHAQEIPIKTADTDTYAAEHDVTHPPLHLTPDRSEIIDFTAPVGSVIIGNPNHINVMADSATRILVIPRTQGASYFTILDQDGNIIMQRHVIVAAEKKDYIRIRRGCGGASEGCQPVSVYYCPDNCHEIVAPDDDGNTGANTDADTRDNQNQNDTQQTSDEEFSEE